MMTIPTLPGHAHMAQGKPFDDIEAAKDWLVGQK
jgi:hypothetical protein